MSLFEGIFYMIWRGIAIGVLISAPMGPVGILCIQRTLDKGRKAGLFTGIGAACSDLLYCLLTGFGLSFIEEFIERNQNVIQLIGSFVLIAFSIYLFRKNPSSSLRRPVPQAVSARKNILGGFLFTFSNPLILFLIIGLFARFNFLMPEMKFYDYIIGYIFIFGGALGWWYGVTYAIDKVRNRFSLKSMKRINVGIGIVILLFAVVGIFTSVSGLASQDASAARHFDLPVRKLHNSSSDTLVSVIPFNHAMPAGWQLSFTAVNKASDLNRSYPFTYPDKSTGMASGPGWGLRIFSGQQRMDLIFSPCETDDGFNSSVRALALSVCSPDSVLSIPVLSGKNVHLNCHGGENRFRISAADGSLALFGGDRGVTALFECTYPFAMADSVAFLLCPAAVVDFSDIVLDYADSPLKGSAAGSIGTIGRLCDYIAASPDPMEGFWKVLDFDFDSELSALGGDYSLAMVRCNDGYEILYLDGARIRSDLWKPFSLKCSLRPGPVNGIFNAVWYDAEGEPVSENVRAQFDGISTLALSFPFLSSTIRLVKSTPPGN